MSRVPDLGLGFVAGEQIEAAGAWLPGDDVRRLVALDDTPGCRGLLIGSVPEHLGILLDGDDVSRLELNPGTGGQRPAHRRKAW
jgi:hypothetical protein